MRGWGGRLGRDTVAGRWRRRAGALGLSVIVALLGAVSGGSVARAETSQQVEDRLLDLQLVPLDGGPPPTFTLPGLDGKPRSLSDLKGQVVLLYFWATW